MTISFQQPVSRLISIRQSARTHTGEALAPEVLETLSRACAGLDRGLMGEAARFEVVEKPFVKDRGVRLGNYGLQKNPRYFFVGAVKSSAMARQSYGYLMEQLVLKATELELGTCWLGFFERKFFGDFKVAGDEIFPAACTVGQAADRRLFEKISRLAVRGDRRRPWEKLFFEGDFTRPLRLDDPAPYRQALEMVRLAPSSGNSQPWRIVKDPGRPVFHFFLKRVSPLYYRAGLHHIDLGIAMCHFELTAREAGLTGRWQQETPGTVPLPADMTYIMSWCGECG